MHYQKFVLATRQRNFCRCERMLQNTKLGFDFTLHDGFMCAGRVQGRRRRPPGLQGDPDRPLATGRNHLLGHRLWGERRSGGVRQSLAVRKLDPATAAQAVQLKQQTASFHKTYTLIQTAEQTMLCQHCYLLLKMLFIIYVILIL